MIAELLNLTIIGGLVGLVLIGLLAWRLRRQVRAIEHRNRRVYEQLTPRTEADFLKQLHNGTLVVPPVV